MKSLVVTTHCSGAKLPRSLEVRGVGDGEDVQGHLLIQELGYGKIFMNSDGERSTFKHGGGSSHDREARQRHGSRAISPRSRSNEFAEQSSKEVE